MSLASKITAAIKPAEPDDQEVAQALDAVEAARKLQSTLEIKASKTATLQSAKRKALAEAALDAEVSGDTAKYKRIETDLALLDADAERIDQAQVAAGSRLLDAEKHLHAMGVQSHVKTARRLCNARAKAAASMVEHLEGYAKDYGKFLEVSDRIVASWPHGVPPNGGGLLWPSEVKDAVQTELARISPRDELSRQPALPGAVFSSYQNSFTLPKFTDMLEAANAHLVALVERGPAN
jgi:hypothetical protein